MDHKTMNLWEEPSVVKAYADAAIECFGKTRSDGIFARIKRRVLGAFKRLTKPRHDTLIVISASFAEGFGTPKLRFVNMPAECKKTIIKEAAK